MTIWAVLCLVLFLITFSTTKERIKPLKTEKTSPKQDFVNLLKNNPWKIMFLMTVCHFCILSFRGTALFNYYHHYADKGALYDWVQQLGLVVPAGAKASGLMETLGYVVHGDRADLINSNVADVANSIINMLGTGITNYPSEFWHWSYGDQGWAYRGGHPHALFAAITPDDYQPDPADLTDEPLERVNKPD